MNARDDADLLLREVLIDAAQHDVRAALLDGMLRQARRRRRARRVVRVALVALAIGAATWFGSLGRSRLGGDHCPVVHTESLAMNSFVRTGEFGATRTIETAPVSAIVRTEPAKEKLRWIGDRELLALTASRPAVLVRVGPGAEKLVFVNSADRVDAE